VAQRYGFVLPSGDTRTYAGKTRTILEALLGRAVDEDESLEMHARKEARYRALVTIRRPIFVRDAADGEVVQIGWADFIPGDLAV